MCPIIGNRWHLTGKDWDLCDAEYQKLDDKEKAQFVKVPPPLMRKKAKAKAKEGNCGAAPPPGDEVHVGVTCDKSGMSPIVGPRWHLVGRNYDLCQAEYDKLDDVQKKEFERVPPRKMWGRPCGFGGGGRGGGGGCKLGSCKLAARFVRDVSIFEGTQMAPGTSFTKIWRLKNSGEYQWPPGTQLCFVGGDQMSANLLVPLSHHGPVMPGEEVDVSVDLIAPRELGRYVGYFRLTGPHARKRFGQRIWAHVQVVDPEAPPLPPTELDIEAEIEKAAEIKAAAASEDEAEASTTMEELRANAAAAAEAAAAAAAAKKAELNRVLGELDDLKKENDAAVPVAIAKAASPAPSVASVSSSVDNVNDAEVAEAVAADGKVVAPPMVAEPLPPSAVEAVEKAQEAADRAAAPVDDALQATALSLAAMGFNDDAIVQHVLEKNGADLDACARDMVSLSEWEETLNDLDEMGFGDVLLNQKLLLKNGGSLKKTVKALLQEA